MLVFLFILGKFKQNFKFNELKAGSLKYVFCVYMEIGYVRFVCPIGYGEEQLLIYKSHPENNFKMRNNILTYFVKFIFEDRDIPTYKMTECNSVISEHFILFIAKQ